MQSRVALTTGGGSGSGTGIARALAERGRPVAVRDRVAAAAQDVVDQIREAGRTASTVVCTAVTAGSAARAGRTVEEHLRVQAASVSRGRIGTPHDIARAVLSCTDDAGFVPGRVRYISGGPHD